MARFLKELSQEVATESSEVLFRVNAAINRDFPMQRLGNGVYEVEFSDFDEMYGNCALVVDGQTLVEGYSLLMNIHPRPADALVAEELGFFESASDLDRAVRSGNLKPRRFVAKDTTAR